ncbi:MAG: ATP-binding cassette domain-containing protein, partial [Candidatus Latescibacterota bacterium]
MLEVRGLTVSYGERTILDGVELCVAAGEVVTIIGGSGSGKSTLLKCIIGLLSPRSGTIRLFGEESTGLAPQERAPLLRQVGVLFQHGALLNSMTVGENVALPLQMHTALPREQIEAMVHTRLALVGLGHAQDLLPEELSGGMRKRAALARALALEPRILFRDEPGA